MGGIEIPTLAHIPKPWIPMTGVAVSLPQGFPHQDVQRQRQRQRLWLRTLADYGMAPGPNLLLPLVCLLESLFGTVLRTVPGVRSAMQPSTPPAHVQGREKTGDSTGFICKSSNG